MNISETVYSLFYSAGFFGSIDQILEKVREKYEFHVFMFYDQEKAIWVGVIQPLFPIPDHLKQKDGIVYDENSYIIGNSDYNKSYEKVLLKLANALINLPYN